MCFLTLFGTKKTILISTAFSTVKNSYFAIKDFLQNINYRVYLLMRALTVSMARILIRAITALAGIAHFILRFPNDHPCQDQHGEYAFRLLTFSNSIQHLAELIQFYPQSLFVLSVGLKR